MRNILIGLVVAVVVFAIACGIAFFLLFTGKASNDDVIDAYNVGANAGEWAGRAQETANTALAGVWTNTVDIKQLRTDVDGLTARMKEAEKALETARQTADNARTAAKKADNDLIDAKKGYLNVINCERDAHANAETLARETLQAAIWAKEKAENDGIAISLDLQKKIEEKIKQAEAANRQAKEETLARQTAEAKVKSLSASQNDAVTQVKLTTVAYEKARREADRARRETAEAKARLKAKEDAAATAETEAEQPVNYCQSRWFSIIRRRG